MDLPLQYAGQPDNLLTAYKEMPPGCQHWHSRANTDHGPWHMLMVTSTIGALVIAATVLYTVFDVDIVEMLCAPIVFARNSQMFKFFRGSTAGSHAKRSDHKVKFSSDLHVRQQSSDHGSDDGTSLFLPVTDLQSIDRSTDEANQSKASNSIFSNSTTSRSQKS